MDVTGNKRRYAPHPFDGTITLEGEHALSVLMNTKFGDRMVVPFDTFKQIGKPRNQNDIHFKTILFKELRMIYGSRIPHCQKWIKNKYGRLETIFQNTFRTLNK